MQVSMIGLDIAKSVFQVHGVDGETGEVFKRRLRRAQLLAYFAGLEPSLVGLEACGGAHHWARELAALGHAVRLLPSAYVKAYVKRGKNDAIDAEAILEALSRPTMRFVPVKSQENQAILTLHKVRAQLVRERTGLVNQLRGHMAEYGLVAPRGLWRVGELKAIVGDEGDMRLPSAARFALQAVLRQLETVGAEIEALEQAIVEHCASEPAAQRLCRIPGVGPIGASALVASVEDARAFNSGRYFAAWLGLTPKQRASGFKDPKGRISKMGNPYLRTLLVPGATAVLHQAPRAANPTAAFAQRLLAKRKPARLVTVALANKTARIVWALLVREQNYRATETPAASGHRLAVAHGD